MAQISESDIGKRVTVRLHDGAGYRDIVGHLQSPTSLKNRHGEIVQFNPADIFIWREIIDQPRTATSGAPLSIRIYELEEIAANTWRAKESERIGGWLFRSDPGGTRRANSALALNSQSQVDQVIDWYRRRNLNPTVQLIPALHQELASAFASRGFKPLLEMNVMVKDGTEYEVNFEFEVSDTPGTDWLAIHGDEKLKELLQRSPSKYISIKNGQELIAIGRASFDSDWAVLSRIWVKPEVRGKGYGRKVLQALESVVGAKKIALQVTSDNQAAVELYKSAGYQTHHQSTYLALPQIDLLQTDCC